MVNDGKVLKNKQMNIEQRILDIHPYAITEPSNDKGRWQTYVKKGDDKRQILRAATYNDLMCKLFNFYCGNVRKQVFTMQQLFEEWLPYKESITDSANTIRRHEQHWKKYFGVWAYNKVDTYDKLELQKQCNLLVKEYSLSSKEWQNIKTILSGMFCYAFEKGYINFNPMPHIKITVKFRQINKKTGITETFLTDEYNSLMKYFDSQYSATGDSVYMALKLDFFCGFRVGELSALKWKDVVGIKALHVCREEIKKSVRDGDSWKKCVRSGKSY